MEPLPFGCIPALSLDTAHSDLGEHLLAVYSGWKLLGTMTRLRAFL